MPSIHGAQSYAIVAQELADIFAMLPQVEAITWAGSLQNDVADAASDIDLYVYTTGDVPLDVRQHIASARGERVEVGNQFWEAGDEWDERASGIHIDVMYRSIRWAEDDLARVLVRHEASIGYTTCIWHNILASRALFDRHGAYAILQATARQPYPEGLRQSIFAKNLPLLRDAHGAYLGQIAKAARRGDLVSVNHRVAALLASYFDLVFALNRKPHPGEKRQVALAQRDCPVRPPSMEAQIGDLLAAAGSDPNAVAEHADHLIAGIEALLAQEQASG